MKAGENITKIIDRSYRWDRNWVSMRSCFDTTITLFVCNLIWASTYDLLFDKDKRVYILENSKNL